MRSCEFDTQTDERAADHAVQPNLDAGPPGELLRHAAGNPRHQNVPERADNDEHATEREERERLVRAVGSNELRDERDEKQHDLRIQHVGDEAL